MPENESAISLSAGRAVRTRNPRSAASSRPAAQRVDFPTPASPSSASMTARAGMLETKPRRDPSSASRPTTPGDMTDDRKPDAWWRKASASQVEETLARLYMRKWSPERAR